MDKGLVLINTGDGKGKTTASIGVLLRSIGYGKKTALIQFIKSPNVKSGERGILEGLGCEVKVFGRGFTFQNTLEENREAFLEGFRFTKNAIENGLYDVIVLDEINCVLSEDCFGAVTSDEILDIIDKRGETSLILTGRGAPSWLIKVADTVTEMREVKHAYKKGIPPKEGIEF